ncbi:MULTISPECIES: carbamate kinase [Actinotignum]|uniref:Carbamate kinase n=1 Tax=Actinotignum timonense TaxID=1870995 RepID=A0AAW9HK63_9ACTO|nr:MULTISPECIES: carbamate kinase [Actinotignum]MBS5748135.1 carbamate kinase [Actinotignum schaalii]MDE1536916.1 carbamate kinase [Actinotignum schaalii]MDE1558775.1 carbamate kinase [Actinotignum schaalii]MDE1663918.1 carbamate kinase [Actinotignum schaalii]MDK6374115.1 carbamate kinase [Actinotignum timonense]
MTQENTRTAGEKIVVALGGNALGKTPEQQLELIKETARSIVDLVATGNDVVVTHGNGPQVGMIKVATDNSAAAGETPSIPFAECGAMSQGYIGYHLQQAIEAELAARQIARPVISVVTQTEVDAADPAFGRPTKPVGAFFTEEQARVLMEETGNKYVEDAGRGWRWVVASPLPVSIVERDVISSLVEAGTIVIAAGGGGIPVVKEGSGYRGVAAVIDKDRTAALLAREVDADTLLILTAVDAVAIDFNKPTQRDVPEMTVAQARQYIEEEQFAPGSMLPKVEACLEFVDGAAGKRAIITSLEKAEQGISGESGTAIIA